jgi:hypothetical protein
MEERNGTTLGRKSISKTAALTHQKTTKAFLLFFNIFEIRPFEGTLLFSQLNISF